MSTLDADLIAAHGRGDKTTLVSLYASAAAASTNRDERAFFLTHAYIFALELGHPDAAQLKSQLAAMGRETP